MSRNEMIRYWMWLVRQGDHEAAYEVACDFYSAWGESIFEYV